MPAAQVTTLISSDPKSWTRVPRRPSMPSCRKRQKKKLSLLFHYLDFCPWSLRQALYLLCCSIWQISQSPETVLDKTLAWICEVEPQSLHPTCKMVQIWHHYSDLTPPSDAHLMSIRGPSLPWHLSAKSHRLVDPSCQYHNMVGTLALLHGKITTPWNSLCDTEPFKCVRILREAFWQQLSSATNS